MATPVIVHAPRREHEPVIRATMVEGGGIRLGVEQGVTYDQGVLYKLLARSKSLGLPKPRTEENLV